MLFQASTSFSIDCASVGEKFDGKKDSIFSAILD